MGAFSHSAGTAPIITVIIQVTTLKTTHLRNHAQSSQNSKIQTSDACHGPRDLNSASYSPVHCSSHSMTSFQSSELTELPVVENSQLFAQCAHSARYAPNQSVSQASSRPDSQSGKQAGRQKHTVWVFSVTDSASSSGDKCYTQNKLWWNGNAADRRHICWRFESRSSDRRRRPRPQLCPI